MLFRDAQELLDFLFHVPPYFNKISCNFRLPRFRVWEFYGLLHRVFYSAFTRPLQHVTIKSHSRRRSMQSPNKNGISLFISEKERKMKREQEQCCKCIKDVKKEKKIQFILTRPAKNICPSQKPIKMSF